MSLPSLFGTNIQPHFKCKILDEFEDTPKTIVSTSEFSPKTALKSQSLKLSTEVLESSIIPSAARALVPLPISRYITPCEGELTSCLLSVGLSSIQPLEAELKGKSVFTAKCVTADGQRAVVKVLYNQKVGKWIEFSLSIF